MLIVTNIVHFWVICLSLGIFIGPAQSASRSMIANLEPPEIRTEMFGLYTLSGKATAFIGPMLVGGLTLMADSQRVGMSAILVFFIVGGVMLLTVPERRGTVACGRQRRYSKVMTFPNKPYGSIGDFVDAYADQMARAFASIDRKKIAAAADCLNTAYQSGQIVCVCGNGGSAAISNHFHCDHIKGVQTDTAIKPRVVSLSSTVETLTAIANDISYDDVFSYQLKTLAKPGDVLITVSSSGDSENIIKAATWAKNNNVRVISFTGFSGGRSADLADINLHVEGDNYGVIEDAHQSIMHILAQYLRLAAMPANLIDERKF